MCIEVSFCFATSLPVALFLYTASFVTNEAVYKDKATGKVVAKQKLTSIHM